ncbi:hypothetical protein EPN96_09570 [bacterium]|nr:MAG: hypothetical protein EPN96_09570 [bacterium]
MPFSWLRPELLFGFAALAAPVLIHLLGRKRKRVIKIATLRFLEKAMAKSAARWRLRRLLLLLSRIAVMGLLAALFAGPGCETAGAGSSARRVIIMDVSRSMLAKENGESSLGRAVAEAEKIVRSSTQSARLAIITTARAKEGDEVDSFTDPAGALGRIESLVPADDDAGLAGALERGAALAASGGGAEIVVLTDMQRNAWRSIGSAENLRAPVTVIDVGGKNPKNGWIDEVVQRGDELSVTLGSSGEGTPPERTVRLRTGSGTELTAFVENGKALFRPEIKESLEVVEVFSEPGGDLETDDSLPFVAASGGSTKVLLINGDPRGFELLDETVFLRRALGSGGKMEGRFDLRQVRLPELAERDLEDIDVAWLANPGAITEAAASLILTRVRSGMGLIVSAGDSLKDPSSPGGLASLLAAPIRDVAVSGGAGKLRPPYQEMDRQGFSGALEPFGEGELSLIAGAHTRKYWLLEVGAGSGTNVLARLLDQAPLVVERGEGKGRLVTVAASVDRDWSDLCLKPQFLPFVDKLLLYAGGRLRREVPPYLVIGQGSLSPLREPVTVVAPSGGKTSLVPGGSDFIPAEAGAHLVESGGRAVAGFVARIDPAESDLEKISPEELEKAAGTASITIGEGGAGKAAGRRDVSAIVAILLLLALIFEALLSGRWQSGKRGDAFDFAGRGSDG